MWRLCTRVAKRERNTVRLFNNNKGTLQKNHQYGCFNLSNCHFSSTNIVYNDSDGRGTPTVSSPPDVALQLDYYMSLQFAGVACALVNGEYNEMCVCIYLMIYAHDVLNTSYLPTHTSDIHHIITSYTQHNAN